MRRNLKKRGIAATAMRRDGSKNYSPLPRRCRTVMLKTINAAAPPPSQRERRGGGSAAMDISGMKPIVHSCFQDKSQETYVNLYQSFVQYATKENITLNSISILIACEQFAINAINHVTGVPKRMATCFVEIFSLLIDFGDLLISLFYRFSFLYKMEGLLFERYFK